MTDSGGFYIQMLAKSIFGTLYANAAGMEYGILVYLKTLDWSLRRCSYAKV
jgi:hypothetical protein